LAGTDEANEGTWISQYTGQPLRYQNWVPGEPNSGRVENCIAVYSAGNFLDFNCLWSFRVMCEKLIWTP